MADKSRVVRTGTNRKFARLASAASRQLRFQAAAYYLGCVAAITLAVPQYLSVLIAVRRGSGYKHSGAESSKINRMSSFVGILNVCRRPNTIARIVTTVIIDALNRVLERRSWPHISNEVAERMSPSAANGYPTTSISIVSSIVRVCASLDHRHPAPVSSNVVVAMPMRSNCIESICKQPHDRLLPIERSLPRTDICEPHSQVQFHAGLFALFSLDRPFTVHRPKRFPVRSLSRIFAPVKY